MRVVPLTGQAAIACGATHPRSSRCSMSSYVGSYHAINVRGCALISNELSLFLKVPNIALQNEGRLLRGKGIVASM